LKIKPQFGGENNLLCIRAKSWWRREI